MLGQDPHGHNAMVFCHGIALTSADGSHHNEHAPLPAKSAHAELCAFAAAGASALLGSILPPQRDATGLQTIDLVRNAQLPQSSLPLRAQTPRGPPRSLLA